MGNWDFNWTKNLSFTLVYLINQEDGINVDKMESLQKTKNSLLLANLYFLINKDRVQNLQKLKSVGFKIVLHDLFYDNKVFSPNLSKLAPADSMKNTVSKMNGF